MLHPLCLVPRLHRLAGGEIGTQVDCGPTDFKSRTDVPDSSQLQRTAVIVPWKRRAGTGRGAVVDGAEYWLLTVVEAVLAHHDLCSSVPGWW